MSRGWGTIHTDGKTMNWWKIVLHNDDTSDFLFVVRTIMELTPLNEKEAEQRALKAHVSGVAIILVTHKEPAELYQEQFTSKGLVVTIEPVE